MLEKFFNFILFRFSKLSRAAKKILADIESELTEEFVELLLNTMSLYFRINKEFRKNIKGFEGRYLFRSRNGNITLSAVFYKGKMKVSEEETEDPHVTVIFKNAQSLWNYILSPKPDILGSLLKQEVVPDGNLNYLYKFAYMANHLRLKLPDLV